ncbi:MAG TPA: AMP-binding protein [Nocardioides sp.]|uniref:class I adenylate-forming enzyme family protein n=1 Tax=Nocardioides sp. TaxID=35761 RepID=UPI002CABBDE1|nr:AMP-binding protein [Nocardioides sp.]HQR25733.1 AMP-binding protein [Nocardioides sp.]
MKALHEADGLGVVGRTDGEQQCERGNAAEYLLEAGSPEDPAILDAGRRFSYADLSAAGAKLANGLVAEGVPPGSRIAILGPNSFFWAAAYLASLRGYVAVPLSDKLSPASIRDQAERVDCRAAFIDRRYLKRFGDSFDGRLPVLTDEYLEGPTADWPTPAAADLDADALLLFTSGTTAAAKVVRLTHRNIVANTDSIITYLGLQRADRMLVVLPFFYCYGLSLLHTHLRVGGSVALCNSFVFPEVALDLVECERCTGFAGVPSTFQMLLRASSFRTRELPSLRLIQQAGGKLSPVLIEELVEAQPSASLFVMYGQTEATARLSYLPPELVLEKLGSIGKGIPGVSLRVQDESGRPVAPGETGEIFACGANISPGYLDEPQASESKFPAGELRTGDLATVDEDGFIYIVDRVDDFIKSWGHRISSQEVEAAALKLRDLVSAAAVGVPDEDAGEAVTLVVTLAPGSGTTADDILTFTRQQLPKHMVPKTVHVVDAIPLNANGKVAKTQVRELVRQLSVASQDTPGA